MLMGVRKNLPFLAHRYNISIKIRWININNNFCLIHFVLLFGKINPLCTCYCLNICKWIVSWSHQSNGAKRTAKIIQLTHGNVVGPMDVPCILLPTYKLHIHSIFSHYIYLQADMDVPYAIFASTSYVPDFCKYFFWYPLQPNAIPQSTRTASKCF